jgi:Trypsin-like peptidase domain
MTARRFTIGSFQRAGYLQMIFTSTRCLMLSSAARAGWTALLIASFVFPAWLPTGAKAQIAKPPMSYGTAFAVTKDGDLVTNEHVVSGCTSVEVRLGSTQLSGEVTVHDRNVDLAIIHVGAGSPHVAALRRLPDVRAGDSAITYGFPLPGILARDGNLTIGYVSALRGFTDNPDYIQFTTPIQPGNSGGALLDSGGNVIGVVARRLNPAMPRDEANTTQSVNFAISLGTLRRFLSQHKIALTENDSTEELRPAEVGDRAKLFSYSIHCAPDAGKLVTAAPSSVLNSAPNPNGERAVLYEEDPSNPYGRSVAGSVLWWVETSSYEAGHSLRTTLLGDINIPGRIKAKLAIEQVSGTDAGLKVAVTFDTAESPNWEIVSAPGIVMKSSEQAKGIPVIVHVAQTGPSSFVLSGIESYKRQNLKLLREQAWFDLPVVYRDGHRAIVALAKGPSGLRAFDQALGE